MISDTDTLRFWSMVDALKPATDPELGACWIWLRGVTPNGYGKFWLSGETVGAHRVAFQLGHGVLDPGQDVTQKCGNRLCCRPEHLEIVTVPSREERYLRALETSRGWKARNRERVREYNRIQEKEFKQTSAGREKRRAFYAANKKRIKERAADRVARRPELRLIDKAKERAKARGFEFSITADDIKVPEICPLLGIPLKHGVGMVSPSSPTLDRIDQARGYTPDNVWVISYRANRIKNDATVEEFLAIADGLRRRLGL